MASSQVEIALTSPFGCVLRKYNRRERCRESNSRTSQGTFQDDDRNFARDHVNNTCNSATPPDEKTHNNQININDAKKNNNNNVGFTKNEKEEESFSSSSSPRQSQILDRWAAKKAREMVSTIETEAELLENLGSSSPRPPSSSTSSEISNRGASSLVQIWEKRLNNINQSPNDTRCTGSPSTTNSALLFGSETREFTDESSSYSDWVSSVTNEPTCSTPRVADIIKRLTLSSGEENNYGQEQCNSNNMMTMMMGPSSLSSSPRLRGRRAFTDLLMQMERDRHGELNNLAHLAPVSNFSQRGRSRIQSLLRLRLLKRPQESTSEVNKQPQGSTIMLLRERFNKEVEQGNTVQTETASSTSPRPNQPKIPHNHTSGEHRSDSIRSDSVKLDQVTTLTDVYGNGNNHLVACAPKPVSQTNEEAHPSSETLCLEAQNVVPQEIAETSAPSIVDSNANHEINNEAEAEAKQCNSAEIESSYVNVGETINEEEYASEGNDYDDELEAEGIVQHYDDETYYDWISPISRPRSYWEDRRQAWYREMLDTATSDKREICQLLERRTVSTFLSSDFRERMDKLMESHIGTQTHLIRHQEDEENSGGKIDQLMTFLQQHIRHAHNLEVEDEGGKQEEEEEEEEEEVQEEESLINGAYNESSDYYNQSSSSIHIPNSSSPNLSSWSYRDNEASDDSDRVESTSSTLPSRSQSFYQDSRQYSSSTNPHSMEMDLIYDMRGQMEQLYREMSEIRKSIKSCIDMQMVLQQSMKRDVNTVREKKKSHDHRAQKKGNCCICYEKKVDSLLYRCGHMCTCVKCANELQWNSGKCPICRAPIADVVRVYVDA